MRMQMRRFIRLTNGFSRKMDNHRRMVALRYMYNFCRIQPTSKVTPATEAGLTDHVWETDELGNLLLQKTLAGRARSSIDVT
jgi:hypothetical protein